VKTSPGANSLDLDFMDLALTLAEHGRGAVEPNPLVGAVVVQKGQVVGVGHHERFGGPHAEVNALAAATDQARGGALYVTLEPCCHQGKTPPCTDAILRAGIARVVAAIRDPFPRVDGGGLAALRAAGVTVELGPRAEAAGRLNAPYLKRLATGLPYVTAKWAMTLDGKTAAASAASQWISAPGCRALVHQLRGRMDAIVVGIGTVLADDPQLTARPPGPRTAVRVVADSQARLPLDSRLVQTAGDVPVLVAVLPAAPADRRQALQERGCEVVIVPGGSPPGVPISPLLEELGRRGMTNVLVEGGGKLIGSFLDAGQVDVVEAYIAPIIEGGDHAHTPARGRGVLQMADAARLEDVTWSQVDSDVRVRGVVPQPWRSILADLARPSARGSCVAGI
jgi:diaminohydroxyphosphoribosylaminopyrimidine deaminase/5-amino-6-(5-phosphoribosylamino)uracil reductase